MVHFSAMNWKRLLAYITGSVDQELLLRNEYLATENRMLRNSTWLSWIFPLFLLIFCSCDVHKKIAECRGGNKRRQAGVQKETSGLPMGTVPWSRG